MSRTVRDVFQSGLKPASKTRLVKYGKTLVKDRDPRIFDDAVEDVLLDRCKDKNSILSVKEYLDSIGYTSSKYQYSQIEEQLERFSAPNHPKFTWNRNFRKAKGNLIRDVQGARLKALNFVRNDDIVDAIPRKSTHAGFSYIETGLRTKGEYLEEILPNWARWRKHVTEEGGSFYPILIGSRTQASGAFADGKRTGTFKSKTRMVSMVDIYQIVSELKFAKPVQRYLSSKSWYAGGKHDISIKNLLIQANRQHHHWLSIDYSAFDQTISDWLMREAFDVVKAMFIDISDDLALFKSIREGFVNKEFVLPDGSLMPSRKGIPSGSMFTQIIGSIVNKLVVDTYCLSKDVTPTTFIMGDDNIIFTHDQLDPVDLSSYVGKNFGLTVSSEKSTLGTKHDDPIFLSRTWKTRGAFRAKEEIISRILFPERYRPYQQEDIEPEDILYGYVSAFPLGMEQLIDVAAFEREYFSRPKVNLADAMHYMPGSVAYQHRYGISSGGFLRASG